MIRLTLIISILLYSLSGYAQEKPKKVALVIGNSNYDNLETLPNPVNDSVAIGNKLESVGFTVSRYINTTTDELRTVLKEFSASINSADTALVYFAGHGIQYEGRNYLLSKTDKITDDNTVLLDKLQSSVNHVDVIDAISEASLKIIMLDACREIPSVEQVKRDSPDTIRSISQRGIKYIPNATISEGLARITAPEGTIISYATQPDNYAIDSTDKSAGSRGWHSPYVSALLSNLGRSGISITEMFNAVAIEVLEATNGSQQPWQSSSPIPEFCFVDCAPINASVEPLVEEIIDKKQKNIFLWGIAGAIAVGLILASQGDDGPSDETITVTTELP